MARARAGAVWSRERVRRGQCVPRKGADAGHRVKRCRSPWDDAADGTLEGRAWPSPRVRRLLVFLGGAPGAKCRRARAPRHSPCFAPGCPPSSSATLGRSTRCPLRETALGPSTASGLGAEDRRRPLVAWRAWLGVWASWRLRCGDGVFVFLCQGRFGSQESS